MPKIVFVNLPVSDVARSTAFYQALGFTKNETFSNAQASAMTWSEGASVMLLDRAFYATFTTKPIADTQATSAALFALSFDSRAEVDTVTEAALAAGGREAHEAKDQGFMYSRAFEDPDGHGWGPFWMDPTAMPPAGDA